MSNAFGATHWVPSKWDNIARSSKACRVARQALAHVTTNTRARVLVRIANAHLVEVETKSTGASRLVEVVLDPISEATLKTVIRGQGHPTNTGLKAPKRLPKRWHEAFDRRFALDLDRATAHRELSK